MPKDKDQNTRAWIERRYGNVTVKRVTLYLASVPVYKGAADGQGMSENDAIESLYQDLTFVENPAVDREPKPARAG